MNSSQSISLCLVIADPIAPWQEVLKNLDEYLVSPRIEILVLDLSSEHLATAKLRESFPYLKWVQITESFTAGELWQRYQYLLKGDVVIWMSVPIMLAPGHLESSVKFLESNPDVLILPNLINLKKQRSIWPKLASKTKVQMLAASKLKTRMPLMCVFLKEHLKPGESQFWSLFEKSGKIPVWHSNQVQVPVAQ